MAKVRLEGKLIVSTGASTINARPATQNSTPFTIQRTSIYQSDGSTNYTIVRSPPGVWDAAPYIGVANANDLSFNEFTERETTYRAFWDMATSRVDTTRGGLTNGAFDTYENYQYVMAQTKCIKSSVGNLVVRAQKYRVEKWSSTGDIQDFYNRAILEDVDPANIIVSWPFVDNTAALVTPDAPGAAVGQFTSGGKAARPLFIEAMKTKAVANPGSGGFSTIGQVPYGYVLPSVDEEPAVEYPLGYLKDAFMPEVDFVEPTARIVDIEVPDSEDYDGVLIDVTWEYRYQRQLFAVPSVYTADAVTLPGGGVVPARYVEVPGNSSNYLWASKYRTVYISPICTMDGAPSWDETTLKASLATRTGLFPVPPPKTTDIQPISLPWDYTKRVNYCSFPFNRVFASSRDIKRFEIRAGSIIYPFPVPTAGQSSYDNSGVPLCVYFFNALLEFSLDDDKEFVPQFRAVDIRGFRSRWRDMPISVSASIVRIDAFTDPHGVMFSAVKESTGVRVSRFPNGTASREKLALVPNLSSPSLWQHNTQAGEHQESEGTIYLLGKDATANIWKMFVSDGDGESFDFMANTPFDGTYKVISAPIGHNRVGLIAVKGTAVSFARTPDGVSYDAFGNGTQTNSVGDLGASVKALSFHSEFAFGTDYLKVSNGVDWARGSDDGGDTWDVI